MMNFDKAGARIFSAVGKYGGSRKYLATLKDGIIHVFYHGVHTFKAKEQTMHPIKLVESSIASNPFVKSSEIQNNVISIDSRQR